MISPQLYRHGLHQQIKQAFYMAVKSCADTDKISRRISMFSMKSLFFYIPYFIQISCSFYLKKISIVLCYNYQFADFYIVVYIFIHTEKLINYRTKFISMRGSRGRGCLVDIFFFYEWSWSMLNFCVFNVNYGTSSPIFYTY